jgi:hypothetical protein
MEAARFSGWESVLSSNQGFTSNVFYQHEDTLRLVMEGLGLTSFPGGAASARDMRETFN